jgi:hypothetical protein
LVRDERLARFRTGPVRCAACGSNVAAALDDVTVVTVGDLRVAFRRHTDHVVCPRCLASNRVDQLRTIARSA